MYVLPRCLGHLARLLNTCACCCGCLLATGGSLPGWRTRSALVSLSLQLLELSLLVHMHMLACVIVSYGHVQRVDGGLGEVPPRQIEKGPGSKQTQGLWQPVSLYHTINNLVPSSAPAYRPRGTTSPPAWPTGQRRCAKTTPSAKRESTTTLLGLHSTRLLRPYQAQSAATDFHGHRWGPALSCTCLGKLGSHCALDCA